MQDCIVDFSLFCWHLLCQLSFGLDVGGYNLNKIYQGEMRDNLDISSCPCHTFV